MQGVYIAIAIDFVRVLHNSIVARFGSFKKVEDTQNDTKRVSVKVLVFL